VSEPWPFVTAHGQREHTGILFDALPKRTQTLATTPTIDRVQMPWWNLEPTLQPASKFKLSTTPLSHPVNVYVKRVPSGMYIKTVRCRLHHNHAKKFYQKDSSFGANHQGSLYGATIDLPPGHFGSGSYVMQVQVVATDGKNDYDSDWWPRLTVH